MTISIEKYIDIETSAGPDAIPSILSIPSFIPGDLLLLEGSVFKILNGSDLLLLGI